MNRLSERIAKLEAVSAALSPPRTVERHVIADITDAARQTRIRAILEAGTGNVLHVFRVIIEPTEAGATIQ